MTRAAIFDLDNTLYDYDAAHAAAWQALTALAESALGLSPRRFEALFREADALLRRRCDGGAAIHDRLLRCQLLLERAGASIALAPEMARRYWSTLLSNLRPLPGAGETLERLRAMGLRVGVGTNMTADYQFEKLRRLGLIRRIDFLVTSEEAGAEKPDARLFRLCAEKAGCPAGECAFVGDSLRGDALGARDAGLRAVWLCRDPSPAAPPQGVERISALPELLQLLSPTHREGVQGP